MDEQVTVSSIMTPDPCGIDEDLTLADATDRMFANNIRHLVVLREGELLGVLDTGDIALCNALSPKNASEVTVRSAVRRVFRCTPADALVDVIQTMEHHHFGCAVVVDAQGDAVGILTVTDVMRALRVQLHGGDVEREVVSSLRPELPDERQKHLPVVRVKRMLRRSGAAPSPSDGLVFATTGL